MTPTNPPKAPAQELKNERLVTMVTKTHRRQLDAASRLPGFKAEADVVRYALDQVLPQLLGEEPAASPRSYAGRTRILVDTAPPQRKSTGRTALEIADAYEDGMREKRVAELREPARLRGPVAAPSVDLTGFEDAFDHQAATSNGNGPSGPASVVQAFDAALGSLGFDPARIAIAGEPVSPSPGDVCMECFCVAPHHASTCSLASDDHSA